MTGPVFHVSIDLTFKRESLSPPLKFIEKRFNFCLKQSALETPLDHEVDKAIQPEIRRDSTFP